MKFFLFAVFLTGIGPLHAQITAMPQPLAPLQTPLAIDFASQKNRLDTLLTAQDRDYDSSAQMLRKRLNSPGYHTQIKSGFVHPTRESTNYAAALLDAGDQASQTRAIAILRRILALQDTDPSSKTYGIWSWHLEEPLSQMAPPDWNWADLIGVQLIHIALYHRQRLPADLQFQIEAAIGHAGRSIIKRAVKPDYTNIAVMDIYVTLVAGELFDNPEFRDYGLSRLQIFFDYTRENGGFTEYNSPTYTVTALEEIGRLLAHVRTPKARPLIETLYRVAWQEIAHHFHVPTRQWAGPHSRNYSDWIEKRTLGLIQRATQNRVDFGVEVGPLLHDVRFALPCPPDLEPYFTRLSAARHEIKTYSASGPPLVATTFLSPGWTLGTINRSDLWNQRRALLFYGGTAAKPTFARLRFLKDGEDFAAAQFFSAQKGGQVVAALGFARDGGDTHIALDPLKNASFEAKDLRLRLEMGGAQIPKSLRVPAALQEPAKFRLADLDCTLSVPFARFGELPGRWESGGEGEKSWLDVVLYSGAAREFDFKTIETAALGLMLQIGENDADLWFRHSNGRLRLRSDALGVNIPTRPALKKELHRDFVTTR